MKKLLCVILGSAISATGYANNWQQLKVSPENQAPVMGIEQENKVIEVSSYTKYKPSSANTPQSSLSIFTEYTKYKTNLDSGISTDLQGFSVGVSTSPTQTGWYGKFENLSDSKFDGNYYSLSMGGQKSLLNYKNFYLLGNVGLGYSWATSSLLSNDVNFISLPVGLELGYSEKPNWSLYSSVGYQWLWDVTTDSYFDGTGSRKGKTLCNDGSWSNSTGQGTCSHHDGVAQNQNSSNNTKDTLGENDGFTYHLGIRYNF